jgi:hypothetical protein
VNADDAEVEFSGVLIVRIVRRAVLPDHLYATVFVWLRDLHPLFAFRLC